MNPTWVELCSGCYVLGGWTEWQPNMGKQGVNHLHSKSIATVQRSKTLIGGLVISELIAIIRALTTFLRFCVDLYVPGYLRHSEDLCKHFKVSRRDWGGYPLHQGSRQLHCRGEVFLHR